MTISSSDSAQRKPTHFAFVPKADRAEAVLMAMPNNTQKSTRGNIFQLKFRLGRRSSFQLDIARETP